MLRVSNYLGMLGFMHCISGQFDAEQRAYREAHYWHSLAEKPMNRLLPDTRRR